MIDLTGVIPITATPFDARGRVDRGGDGATVNAGALPGNVVGPAGLGVARSARMRGRPPPQSRVPGSAKRCL
jgi:hypothetical protein